MKRMNDSVSDLHKRTIELLPWYVSGTLSAEEKAELDRHIGQCIPCRAALQDERRMHALIGSQEDVPLNAEHGIGDLMSRIDRRTGHRGPLGPRYAWGAAIAGIVLVGSFLMLRGPAFDQGLDQGRGSFTTLTDSETSASSRIDIVLADDVDAAEIYAVVAAFGGSVIAGPSELGRYTVALPDGESAPTQQVIDALTDDPRVRFVSRNFIAVPDASGDER